MTIKANHVNDLFIIFFNYKYKKFAFTSPDFEERTDNWYLESNIGWNKRCIQGDILYIISIIII
jgi:hypothetical protein